MHITTIAFFSAAAAVMAAPSAPILAPKIWTATSSDGNVVPGTGQNCNFGADDTSLFDMATLLHLVAQPVIASSFLRFAVVWSTPTLREVRK